MRGTEKQIQYAKDIMSGLHEWAEQSTDSRSDDIAAEIDFIETVESGDLEKAEQLAESVKRLGLIYGPTVLKPVMEDGTVSAEGIIEVYKKDCGHYC